MSNYRSSAGRRRKWCQITPDVPGNYRRNYSVPSMSRSVQTLPP